MRRLLGVLTMMAALLALAPASAQADFGLNDIEVEFTNSDGTPATQAGSHPFQMRTAFMLNTKEEDGGTYVEGALRSLDVFQPAGFAGTPTPVPRCSSVDFLRRDFIVKGAPQSSCPDSSALGYIINHLGAKGGGSEELRPIAVYNLEPPPGAPAKFGFWVENVPITVEAGVNGDFPNNIVAKIREASQVVEIFGSELILWGNPADPVHDPLRGHCLGPTGPTGESCSANVPVRPFLTLPRSCKGDLQTLFRASPWWVGESDAPQAPQPSDDFEGIAHTPGMSGCGKLGFSPRFSAQPTSDFASSPTGLEVAIEIDDEGLLNPTGTAHSDISKAVVTLPEGMTANPSLAAGLAVCSEADLDRETLASAPGAGCPPASKIGTVEVQSPLLEGELLRGALYVAEPYANRFGTLLALYIVIKHPQLGIIVKLAGRVDPDPRTGQLTSTFDQIPELPVSDFRLRFREGGRSPLISPPACGPHTTTAVLTPSANPGSPLTTTSTFQITHGVGGGPCPGPAPFDPGFGAGSINAQAGAHTPFFMRLTRRDGDQDLTRFDAALPPGLTAKLAGVAWCPDAAIAQLASRTGKAELADPACPAASRIGSVWAGAGVGSQLTYVPGSVYLAGPFAGAPLSVIGVVPAVAGPFDVGVVATRQALSLDPLSAEVTVDGARSQPIPHILAGIPLAVRDIQISVDRPSFTLNPTSCERMAIEASIWGGGLDPFSLLDDAPVARTQRFQAANCAALGFKPRLSFSLKGGKRRGANPALTAVLRPRPGDANLKRAVVRFPRSTFLDQGHIRTVCTRVQFAAEACPPGSIYGQVTAHTPLLEQPLKGPVYLRSSNNLLPDIVFDLHGLIDIEAAARADSVKGRLRVTFPAIPDAPVSKVVVRMQGAKKGLLVNSRNICSPVPRAQVAMEGHNAKRTKARVAMRLRGCGGARR